MFKKWRQQKRKIDAENEKVLRARAILKRNYKARVLQAWRVVNQEQQIISPMVARRERKEMARYAFGVFTSRCLPLVREGQRDASGKNYCEQTNKIRATSYSVRLTYFRFSFLSLLVFLSLPE